MISDKNYIEQINYLFFYFLKKQEALLKALKNKLAKAERLNHFVKPNKITITMKLQMFIHINFACKLIILKLKRQIFSFFV